MTPLSHALESFVTTLTATPLINTHLSPTQLPLALAATASTTPILALTTTGLRQTSRLHHTLSTWTQFLQIPNTWHLLAGTLSEQEQSGDIVSGASLALHHLYAGTPHHHFLLPQELEDSQLPNLEEYRARLVSLHVGERMSLHALTKLLTDHGFRRHDTTLEPGTFRVRGEHVDLKHPIHEGSFTITLFGSSIETLIDHHQRRSHALSRLTLPPVSFPSTLQPLSDLLAVLPTLTLWRPQHSELHHGHTVTYDALTSDISLPLTSHQTVPTISNPQSFFVLTNHHERIREFCRHRNLPEPTRCSHQLADIPFIFSHETFILASEAALLATTERIVTPVSYQQGLELITQLTAGKPAVHADHGIGIYEGLHTRRIESHPREYLVLRYAGGDTVSVPVEYAHKVTAYLGDTAPTLNRLGGAAWATTKRHAQAEAAAFAQELIETAGQRAKSQRPLHSIDPDRENELEQSFPHKLTPDQLATWQAVQHDLEQDKPMDRLIVGDVGFGKTELAIRAAYHVASSNRQVAVLAPTTLLVQQHADTFRQRLPQLRDRIGVLSRFASPQEQRDVRRRASDGSLAIIIGTHALLNSSMRWHNLALVIIDEEQRFGVKQKEHFKRLRANLDILSLSATPIPRTLSMALTGLKDLSIIATPPPSRQDSVTRVSRDNDDILKDAITAERNRGGQVYVVAPKIRYLASLARRIQTLHPDIRLAIAHGQLLPAELAHIMAEFDQGKIDVLVSSTIIANGLDLPNANTLIVTHATHLGLADLYQLRGRIGRRERQGYAYFLYNQSELTAVQRQRLTALTEASRLGSGWQLAQRDLEIRGAGNLLGAEQSGTVNAVGIQFYLDLIHDAVATQREGITRHAEVDIQLPLTGSIPPDYIADIQERTNIYQKLSRARTVIDLQHEFEHLKQQYGAFPPDLEHFYLLLKLQHAAAQHAITRITYKTISPRDEEPYHRLIIEAKNLPQLVPVVGRLGNWVVRHTQLTWDVDGITPDLIKKIIDVLT